MPSVLVNIVLLSIIFVACDSFSDYPDYQFEERQPSEYRDYYFPQPSFFGRDDEDQEYQASFTGNRDTEGQEDRTAYSGNRDTEDQEDQTAYTGNRDTEDQEDQTAYTGNRDTEDQEDQTAHTGNRDTEDQEDQTAYTGNRDTEDQEDQTSYTGNRDTEDQENQTAYTGNRYTEDQEDQDIYVEDQQVPFSNFEEFSLTQLLAAGKPLLGDQEDQVSYTGGRFPEDQGQSSSASEEDTNSFYSRRSAFGEMLKGQPLPGCHPSKPDDEEREAIANVHNNLRRKVARGEERRGKQGPQPPAKNMKVLNYDIRLEELAFKWASHCTPHLPKDKPIGGYRSVLRSVLYQKDKTEKFNSTDAIKNRFERVKYMNGLDAIQSFNGKNSISGEDVRTYAIIVNADTYGVGCAHSLQYNETTGKTERFYVCNYGSGIRKNSPLYQSGQPCEGLKSDCCDRGLVRAYCWSLLDK